MELATLISRHSRFRPDATAVVFEDQRLTYRQFTQRVDAIAAALQAMGIGKGDKVATVLPNCRELLEIYWAVPRIGAVLVPLSPLLMASGLKSLLQDSDARCVFTQLSLSGLVREARSEIPELPADRVVVIDGSQDGSPSLEGLLAGTPAAPSRLPSIESGDLFNIMYTSGTTGLPKGIMHTHYIRAMYCTLMAAAWRMTPESVVLHSGAIVFNGAFVTLMPAFFLGATYVLQRQFNAEAMIEAIRREKVTHIMLVPAQIIAMLDSPRFSADVLSSLEMILSLGAPLHQERKDELNRLLPGRFHELYGLTEGFVTILDKHDAVRKSGSVGCTTPFFEMRIVREDGTDAAPGEVGEIVGRGPILMTGYYKRPDLTAQAIRDGWLFTGDMGMMDEEGYLHLVDRKKDMIDSGGVKVYPKDVEEVAARHPAVREVAVFGVPHEKWGETPVAAVVLKEPGTVSAEALRDWINERVGARYQRVSEVILMEEFPRNAAGKTLKRSMRDPYWAGQAKKI
jgi:acyl-CoA synthetase (AMP-forming)/AMP-acid ligase II